MSKKEALKTELGRNGIAERGENNDDYCVFCVLFSDLMIIKRQDKKTTAQKIRFLFLCFLNST